MVTLNPVEARVLGCLIEKEITTPEYYPLSLNATLNASNQKSSREPVMELTESDVRSALFELTKMGLVRTIADARVSKFEHRIRDILNLRRDEVPSCVSCCCADRRPRRNFAPAPNACTASTITPPFSQRLNALPPEKKP